MSPKQPYETPDLQELGMIADLTQVGITTEGADTFPGRDPKSFEGSVCPDGLNNC